MQTDAQTPSSKIPVILDTDIGTDIDDTWALALLLKSPELDLKLILTSTGDTYLRAKIVAKMLEAAGRTDIPIALGIPLESAPCYQEKWVEGYDLALYEGQIIEDGIGAFVEAIQQSPEPVTVIGISPAVNIAAALQRDPTITRKSRFIGMFGSVRRGYFGNEKIAAEYNVVRYPHSLQKVFAADWDMTITPLDTCGILQLKGEKYRQIRDSSDPMALLIMENYRIWSQYNANPVYNGFDPETESSILYDAVAVYLAFSKKLLKIEALGVQVNAEGFTLLDASAKPIHWATEWHDLPAFEDFLIARLTQ